MTTFQICVLNIQASSLVAFHDSDLKPYVVFLTPPSPNVYKMQKQQQGEVLKVHFLKMCVKDSLLNDVPSIDHGQKYRYSSYY